VLRLRGLKELTEAFPSSAPQANVPGMDATLPPARQQEFEVPEADGELHIPALGHSMTSGRKRKQPRKGRFEVIQGSLIEMTYHYHPRRPRPRSLTFE
jgi:hypothetical protein